MSDKQPAKDTEKPAAKDTEKPAAKDTEPQVIVDANSAAVDAYRHPIEGPPDVAPTKKGT